MRSALSISLPGARRRGQLALPADEAAVFVPVMMAAQKPVATTPSITIETAGIVVRHRSLQKTNQCRQTRSLIKRWESSRFEPSEILL